MKKPASFCLLAFAICLSTSRPAGAFSWEDVDIGKAASGGGKLIKAVAGLSDDDEIKVGREVAANLAARYGLNEDPAKLRYLNLAGLAVARRCDRSNLTYHFAILKSNELNAFAAPGGYIFVTEGLLNFLKDEAELAGVLAHEIAHVTQRHIVKAIRQANALAAAEDLAAAGGHDIAKYQKLSDFSIHLLSKGLSRDDELEADRLGTALAARVGYDPTGLRTSVERIGAGKESDILLARFNKTHPPTAERLRAIDKALAKNHLSAKGQRLPERFAKNIVPAVSPAP